MFSVVCVSLLGRCPKPPETPSGTGKQGFWLVVGRKPPLVPVAALGRAAQAAGFPVHPVEGFQSPTESVETGKFLGEFLSEKFPAAFLCEFGVSAGVWGVAPPKLDFVLGVDVGCDDDRICVSACMELYPSCGQISTARLLLQSRPEIAPRACKRGGFFIYILTSDYCEHVYGVYGVFDCFRHVIGRGHEQKHAAQSKPRR